MFLKAKKPLSESANIAIDDYEKHVSFGKVKFFKKYEMDFVMGRREGPYLWDIDGKKRLLNLHCNGGVFNLGHRNSAIIEVLKNAVENFDIGNHHLISKARADLAKKIAALMPGDLQYTIFGVGGGEAVDLAIKVVRAYTGREKIISFQGGYHGHTGFALASGDAKYREPFGPKSPGFTQIPFGDIPELLQEVDKDTAAVIMESVPATLGIVIPEKDFVQKLREVCDQTGTLLIIDEVQTGLGRTGKNWGFEHFDIIPDIVVLGKGLSGGLYPISATVLRKDLEKVFHPDPFIHISTFGGSEVGCMVASKVLEISSDHDFLSSVNKLAALFADKLEQIHQKFPDFIRGYRQLGLMMGIETRDEISGPILTKTAYDNDLLIIYANNDSSVCQFLPPLIIEEEEIEYIFAQLEKAVKEAIKLRPLLLAKEKFDGLFKKK